MRNLACSGLSALAPVILEGRAFLLPFAFDQFMACQQRQDGPRMEIDGRACRKKPGNLASLAVLF